MTAESLIERAREAVAKCPRCRSKGDPDGRLLDVLADIARQQGREPRCIPAAAWPLGRPPQGHETERTQR